MGKRSHPEDRAPNGNQIEIVTQRLESAGIDLERFIDVKKGRKQSFDHDQCDPDEMSGNYGVYCGRGLLGVDIDDRIAWDKTPGTEDLPETFTVSTPHDGEHRYYRVTTKVPVAIRAVAGGSLNPSRQWGELYTSKYLVGPGSEIYECDKSDCHGCKDYNPGRYEIEADRPIARISSDDTAPLLHNHSKMVGARQAAIAEFNDDIPEPLIQQSSERYSEVREKEATFQLHLGEKKPTDPDKQVVWGIVRAQTATFPGPGAKLGEIIDDAGECGIGVYRTNDIMMAWEESGFLRRSEKDSDRFIPQQSGWEQ